MQTKQLLFKAINKIQYKKKQITKRSYYNYCYIYVTLLVTMLPSIGKRKTELPGTREKMQMLFFLIHSSCSALTNSNSSKISGAIISHVTRFILCPFRNSISTWFVP